MIKIFVISGSRHWDAAQIPMVKARVQSAVSYAQANSYVLFTGDAPGVDAFAMQYAAQMGVKHVVHGINGAIRLEVGEQVSVNTNFTSYTDRDEYMVSAADFVWCLWNGTSSGTQAVYRYAKLLRKTAWIEQLRKEAA